MVQGARSRCGLRTITEQNKYQIHSIDMSDDVF